MELFENKIECNGYNVILCNASIVFEKGGNSYRIPSDFRNKYDAETGIIIIENVYMRFTCILPHQATEMFDFIARGFQVNIITDNKQLSTDNIQP